MNNGIVVSHNIQGMFTNRQLGVVENKKNKSIEKLSSGYRINRAADDAAGLAISEKMRKQIRGLTQGNKNVQDGISMCQIADGAISEVSDILHRMTELSVQAANGTNDFQDRQEIQKEVNQLLIEIDRVTNTTTFNDKKIFQDQNDSEILLSSYDVAKKALIDANYITLEEDVSLKDGSIINKQDANSIIRLLSNVAIIGKGIELYNDVKDNYSPNYKGVVIPVKEYIISNRNKILENTKPLYSYGESSEYTQYMEEAENALVASLRQYESVGYLDEYEMDRTTMNAYSDATNTNNYNCPKSGYYIALGLFFTDSLMYVASRTMGYSYENKLDCTPSSFLLGIQEILKKNNITRGELQKEIEASLRYNGNTVGKRLKEGNTGIDLATRLYMIIANIEDEDDSTSTNSNEIWIQASNQIKDGINLHFGNINTSILGISGIEVLTEEGASNSITKIKSGLEKLSSVRSEIGSQQNRLEHTIRHQENTIENTQKAESQIRETDIASEMVQLTANNIIHEAGQAMLSKANQSSQGVMQLLQ